MVGTIIQVHNYYQQPGGEDAVFASEADLLSNHGHRVLAYTDHNDRIKDMRSLNVARTTIWNEASYRDLRMLFRQERPSVAHFHNTFPLVSPAAYYAAKAEGVPIVQTLHNYRLFCLNSLFFRDGHPCEDCLGKSLPWPGVLHSCYRGSRAASGIVAAMLTTHRALRTWVEIVDIYIALTEFAREKFTQGGIPSEKVAVKPHFVHPDSGAGEERGKYALFAGRLSAEKGVQTLLTAWKQIGNRMPLKIVGQGPLAPEVAEAVGRVPGVEWLGRLSKEQTSSLMRSAQILILPSICYENFPMVIVEAYAAGLPVIGSKIGSITSLIRPGHTGLHFCPNDPEDLANKIGWVLSQPAELNRMRWETRAEFEAKYSAELNYRLLMDIYRSAIMRTGVRV